MKFGEGAQIKQQQKQKTSKNHIHSNLIHLQLNPHLYFVF